MDCRSCLALLLALLALTIGASNAKAASAESRSIFEQRSLYLQARAYLRQGRTADFRRTARALDDYILRPYLDYHRLRASIGTVSSREVLDFLTQSAELPATHLLHKRWLRELGKRRQWQLLRDNFIETNDADLRCYHLRALYGTGERAAAMQGTTNLWLQPVSQPKACDPLFEVWRASPQFTEEVAWMRLNAAISANQRQLARYLLRYFSGANKTAAEAFYNAHISPSRMARSASYRADTDKIRLAIEHGLMRLSNIDPEKAQDAWRRFGRSHQFDDLARQRIESAIAVGLAEENRFPSKRDRNKVTQASAIEALALAAVRAMNWPEAAYWIERLEPDLKQKSQWQYWLARALIEHEGDNEQSQALYANLARERHYYGFLSARRLGLNGRLNDASVANDAVALTQLANTPGIARSLELFAVGDDINGRREWYAALDQLPDDQQVNAAELAQMHGLTSLAIRSANIAEARDYLRLRFPISHEPQFRRAALKSALPVPLLIAIARQESALESNARSSADARGLMQLLPSTARLVARRAGLDTPSANDLYDPSTNIRLGSYHLAWLIERYDGQTPLAIAAYNAGEHRVDRWIKDAAGMPVDVWIERIPFRETRNYAKNVLAFRHVYAQRLGMPAPLLDPDERYIRTP